MGVIQEGSDTSLVPLKREGDTRFWRLFDAVIEGCVQRGYDRGILTLRLHAAWTRVENGQLVPVVICPT